MVAYTCNPSAQMTKVVEPQVLKTSLGYTEKIQDRSLPHLPGLPCDLSQISNQYYETNYHRLSSEAEEMRLPDLDLGT